MFELCLMYAKMLLLLFSRKYLYCVYLCGNKNEHLFIKKEKPETRKQKVQQQRKNI